MNPKENEYPRDGVTIICNSKVILKLMEAHLQRLAIITKECGGIIPPARASLALQRLGFGNDLFVASASPETLVVIGATGLVGLVGFHLGLAEVLQLGEQLFMDA